MIGIIGSAVWFEVAEIVLLAARDLLDSHRSEGRIRRPTPRKLEVVVLLAGDPEETVSVGVTGSIDIGAWKIVDVVAILVDAQIVSA